jgi:hypothetical protein
MDLAAELQRIYDSEINAEITWFWDGGFTVRLGRQDERLPGRGRRELGGRYFTLAPEAIAHFYPGSDYAQSLDPELRARAVSRVFRPPRTGLQVRCPHWGAERQRRIIR